MVKKIFILLLFLVAACFCGYKYYLKAQEPQKEKFVFWTIQLKPVAQKIIEKNIEKIEKKYKNLEVVWVDIPIAEAQKRTLAVILGGNTPDLINLNPEFSFVLAQKGALDYFNNDEVKNFSPSVMSQLKYGNNIFALPFYATSPITLYNKRALDFCEIENVPTKYNELYLISKELKKCSGKYPLSVNLAENNTFSKILNKYNVSSFENDNDIRRASAVFSMFNTLYKGNLIPKDSITIDHREMAQQYMADSALFVVLGSNFLNMVKQNAPSVFEKSDVAPQLLGASGKYDVSLMNFVIPKTAKNKKVAKEFLLMLTSAQTQVELAKKTNVIPVNEQAFLDPYFQDCESDLMAKAKCISIEQLKNSGNKNFGDNNKKEIDDNINNALQKILLTKEIKTQKDVAKEVKALAAQVDYLMKN